MSSSRSRLLTGPICRKFVKLRPLLCKRRCQPYPRVYQRSHHSFCSKPLHPSPGKKPKTVSSPLEALSVVKSGDVVYVHGLVSAPTKLTTALAQHAKQNDLKDVKIFHLLMEDQLDYLAPELWENFRCNSWFAGSNTRLAINKGRVDFTPIFSSDIPLLFHRHAIKPDVTLTHVTPADKHGFHSLGLSLDCTREAITYSKVTIGQVNPKMPRTFGDTIVHESCFDILVPGEIDITEVPDIPVTEVDKLVGKHIAENLVEDGATLQIGNGGIPNAVLSMCENHKDLGVHSELLSEGVVDLFEKGVISNRFKYLNPGEIETNYAIGRKKLIQFVDRNPIIVMRTFDYMNNEWTIAQNPKVTAINSCIEVDIVGEVCSDSIGPRHYSGFGGQLGFLRGAALSLDGKGKPILAMHSTTGKGESKIVPFLKHGASVVTTRAHAHYVVTEYGIAYLFGKNYRQRAHALIQIAHPNHREYLEKAAFERLKCLPAPY